MNDNEKHIEEFVNGIPFDAPDNEHRDELKKQLLNSFPKHRLQPTVQTVNVWRNIMKRKTTKLAVAAVIIIAVAISVNILDKSVTPAYAIEQTIEANRGLWFIHLKCEPSTNGHVDEIWAQFDDNRQLTNLRMNYLNSMDGPKDVVWHEGKAEIWFKARKRIVVLGEEDIPAQMKSYKSFDPKRIVEELYQAQDSENVQIKIQESSAEGEPIIITMTQKDSPDLRTVYKVDPETKLLQQSESYKLKEGEYKFVGRIRYLDYNNPADLEIFVLKPPADVFRVDPTQEIGLAKGELSDDEIAVEVVRQFFQALIAEDYTKAGRLFGDGVISADQMQQMLGHTKFLRIVSIEPAGPNPNLAKKGLVVPCTVEIEKDGQIHQWKLDQLRVWQVDNQPGRWTMRGF
ncbi:MAG: hypothetical protein H8D56_03295 [Planctomycetes bacterium]|nr:hypothetical protein [Planctomycetota bacterium]MBL7143159.1 hypothetical protein [Phycisphaerae bacterium]